MQRSTKRVRSVRAALAIRGPGTPIRGAPKATSNVTAQRASLSQAARQFVAGTRRCVLWGFRQ
jgi:hypothetical protein